jgi:site-specific DNA-methyltransferase (adenine-specific)
MIDLRLGDCLKIMKTLPDKSIDCVVTDPPYNMTELGYDKRPLDWEALWPELKRVLKSNGVIALFSAEPFTTDLIVSNRSDFRYDLIWCKTMGTRFYDANKMPLRAHETILIFAPSFHGAGNPKTSTYNPQFWFSEPYYRKHQKHEKWAASRTNHYNNCSDPLKAAESPDGRRYPLDWLVFSNGNNGNVHPSQKPLDLISWLVSTYSNPCDCVLDFTMGSGTTGIACVQTGRNFIGIEIDPTYFSIAEKRITESQQQLRLAI